MREHFLTEDGWAAWQVLLEELANTDATDEQRADILALFDLDDTVFTTEPGRWNQPVIDHRFPTAFGALALRLSVLGYLSGREIAQMREFGLLLPGVYGLGEFGMELSRQLGNRCVNVDLVDVPPTLSGVRARLREMEQSGRWARLIGLEEKRHVIAVHQLAGMTDAMFQALRLELDPLAEEAGLKCQLGHEVLEIGPEGVTKGESYRRFLQFLEIFGVPRPKVFLFVDDSGTGRPVFDAMSEQRAGGEHVIKVCSNPGNLEMARSSDLVVAGTSGTLELVSRVYEAAIRRRLR